jgi:hypothetical protein
LFHFRRYHAQNPNFTWLSAANAESSLFRRSKPAKGGQGAGGEGLMKENFLKDSDPSCVTVLRGIWFDALKSMAHGLANSYCEADFG